MFKKILSGYLLIWLTLICMLAYYWPEIQVASRGMIPSYFCPFNVPGWAMQIMIAVTMLAIGSLLPVEEVKMVIRRWPRILSGTAVQFISMPLLAYLMGRAFHLEGPWFIGIMLVGCVPGAMASNMLTMISKGNVSYSVGLTTSSTFLSPLMVPLLLAFFLSTTVKIDVSKISCDLLLTVVCPVIIGFTLSRLLKWWRITAEQVGEIVANIVIIWIIASVSAKNHGCIGSTPGIVAAALICLNIGGYLAGWFGGFFVGLDDRMRRALTLEVGMQNAGLGTYLATTYFASTPQAAIVCAMYTFGCMFTGIVLAQLFRLKKTQDERAEEIR
ncbi:MAG: bile acid:sodium symporter family protein [Planctomycetia bacterium]|nr:bile acid:sodium symporter family protein [Planctomycetia bacterium]